MDFPFNFSAMGRTSHQALRAVYDVISKRASEPMG